jgi:hypothetical protein
MNKKILKSVGAVVAGLLAIVVLSTATDGILWAAGIMPKPDQPQVDALLLLAAVYRTLYSIAGAYLTARLAPDKPVQHALVLGAIGIVLGLVGLVATWNWAPSVGHRWYPIALVLLALPQCWLGGKLRLLQLRK